MKRIAALLLCLFLPLLASACRQESVPIRPTTVLQLAVQRGISSESTAGLDCFTNKVRELSGGAGDGSRQPGRGHHGAGHGRAG